MVDGQGSIIEGDDINVLMPISLRLKILEKIKLKKNSSYCNLTV